MRLGKRSQQKYRISMKHNKVIDVGVRENFCSLFCYRASKHLEAQVPHHPVWLRNNNTNHPMEVTVLQKEQPSSDVGKDVGEIAMKLSGIDISEIENPRKEKTRKSKKKNKRNSDYYDESESSSGDSGCSDVDEETVEALHYNNETSSTKTKNERTTPTKTTGKRTKLVDHRDLTKKDKNEAEMRKCLDKMAETLDEWLTEDSLRFMHNLKQANKTQHDSDDDSDDDHADGCFPQSDELPTQVQHFLSRQPEWLSEACLSAANGKTEENTSDTDEEKSPTNSDDPVKRKVMLPSIDSRSQTAIRRRIVHEKVSRCLRDVLPVCGLLEEDLNQISFFKLVDAFNFTSKNIVLNSKQWTCTCILLVVLISRLSVGNFCGVKNRMKDIDDFLNLRGLPNLGQMEGIVKDVLGRVSEIGKPDVVAVDSSVTLSEQDKTKYYYDQMEEVD